MFLFPITEQHHYEIITTPNIFHAASAQMSELERPVIDKIIWFSHAETVESVAAPRV